MPKIKIIDNHILSFKCPGCGLYHDILFEGSEGQIWEFDGNIFNPTINPSIKSVMEIRGDEDKNYKRGIHICHSFVKSGFIEFLSDCTHSLAGKTIPLPDIE